MRIKHAFLSLSLFILLGASALAQSGEAVNLQLIDANGKVIAKKTVAKDGSFNFDNLPSGDYRVKVRFPSLPEEKAAIKENGKQSTMPNRISTSVTVPKQTQGATFGEKVNAGLATKSGKVTSEENSAGINEITGSSETRNSNSSGLTSMRTRFTVKMQMVSGAEFLKVEKATSGLKDTLKTQVRTINPGAVTVESWTWGETNNAIEYSTENENKLEEGVDAFIKVGDKKSISGKVLISHKTTTR